MLATARRSDGARSDSSQGSVPVSVIIVREMVGLSPHSWSDAARRAVDTAAKTVRNIEGIEVVKSTADVVRHGGWEQAREPYALETSAPGVFAVGDVRSGSVKRVAAAVGEGGVAIAFVHRYLQLAS